MNKYPPRTNKDREKSLTLQSNQNGKSIWEYKDEMCL